jgi:multidrug efflux system membrane fusion protein
MIGAVDILADARAPGEGKPAGPLAAVVRNEANARDYSVFVVFESGEKSIVRSRAVTLGAVEGNLVSVTAGLSAGERVVVMGATLLTDGETVRVIP